MLKPGVNFNVEEDLESSRSETQFEEKIDAFVCI
jgi:hypothetical protein